MRLPVALEMVERGGDWQSRRSGTGGTGFVGWLRSFSGWVLDMEEILLEESGVFSVAVWESYNSCARSMELFYV